MNTNIVGSISPEKGFFMDANTGAGGGAGGGNSGKDDENKAKQENTEDSPTIFEQLRANLKNVEKLIRDYRSHEAIELLKESRQLHESYEPSSEEDKSSLAFFVTRLRSKAKTLSYDLYGDQVNFSTTVNSAIGKNEQTSSNPKDNKSDDENKVESEDKEEESAQNSPPPIGSTSLPPSPPSGQVLPPASIPSQPEQFSLIEVFRKKSLTDLFGEFQTESIQKNEEIRFVLFQAIEEKANSMRADFIDLAIRAGETADVGEKRFKDFVDLIDPVFSLIDYGVLSARSLNTNNLTAKHESLIQSLTIDGAMAKNKEFNNNPLVNSGSLTRYKYDADMGIIQKMVFAAYQEMKKTPRESAFSRNEGFDAERTKKLFTEYLPQLNRIEIVNEMDVGQKIPVVLNIKKELEKFPPEARKFICFIAKLKTTRDDFGSKAGLWHLGRHKGAFKFSDGEKGRPTGLLSAIFYNVGKNSAREMHAASLAWIDPRNIELAAQGRTRGAMNRISRKEPIYSQWNITAGADSEQNQKVIFMMEEVNNFLLWKNPNWEKLGFEKYTPQFWDQDFPAIDEMTNQVDKPILPDDYQKSKNAFLKIIETANSVFASLTLSSDPTQMREKIQVLLKNVSSEIAKAMSYLGQYEVGNKYYYAHQLIDAAVRFYLWGILNAVPGKETYLGDKIGTMPVGSSLDYAQLYNIAITTMVNQISVNTSLKNGYQKSFLEFLKNPNIKKPFINYSGEILGFNTWRLKHNPDLKGLGYLKRQAEYDSPPECPVNVSAGWTSSYLDPAVQRSI